ncbi:MAG TPA: HAD-IC family P-type ATPase, partial [Sphingobacteriaceae bacterium]
MSTDHNNPFPFNGLTTEAVRASREKHGNNEIRSSRENPIWEKFVSVIGEPMFIILVVSTILYYSLGEIPEATFMLGAILFVAAISIYQDSRSRSALAALRTLTAPKAKVIRQGKVLEILSKDIVLGDFLVVEEGGLIAADGTIVQANDFAVNESILTGESFSVNKGRGDQISKGTLVVGGLAVCEVTAIGAKTALGRIGKSIESIKEERTPLQNQIDRFVKQMALIGGLVFLLVWFVNYSISAELLDSLLKALTLAMSILPEEIPVAFTTFMALGAWRLMKKGIIVKGTQTVETLGSATVICTDKTGTITENRMHLAHLYLPGAPSVYTEAQWPTIPDALSLVEAAMWASEPVPFDPMEIALHKAYQGSAGKDRRNAFKMVHEYPLSGKPPMMT